jgi:hypothetical protein
MEIGEKIENIFFSPEHKNRTNMVTNFKPSKKIRVKNHYSNNNLLINELLLNSSITKIDKNKRMKRNYENNGDVFYHEFMKKLNSEDVSPSINISKISKKKQSQIKIKQIKKEKYSNKELSNLNNMLKLNLNNINEKEILNEKKKKKNKYQDGILGICKINHNINTNNNQNLNSTVSINKKLKNSKIDSLINLDKNEIQKVVEFEILNHYKKFDLLEIETNTNIKNVTYTKDDFRKQSKESNLNTNNVSKRDNNNLEKDSEENNINDAVIYYSIPSENKKKRIFLCCF